jgi:hypothetical protein
MEREDGMDLAPGMNHPNPLLLFLLFFLLLLTVTFNTHEYHTPDEVKGLVNGKGTKETGPKYFFNRL